MPTKATKAKAAKPEQQKEKAVLFDATIPQDVSMQFKYQGRDVTVTHRLNFPSDERLLLFFNASRIEQKIISETEVNTNDLTGSAALELWNELALSRSGYQQNDREDWKEKTNVLHKETAIGALLSVVPVMPEVLDAEFVGVPDDETELVTLRSLFNGQYIETKILMNQPNADQMRRYRLIRDGSFERDGEAVVTINSVNVSDRADLFDELFVSQTGYKAHIPLTHKAQAARALFENQIQIVAKNS